MRYWTVAAACLLLAGACALTPGEGWAMELRDKTLVAWVSPADLEQRAGSVLTLDDRRGHFDGLIFGELEPGRWMAGSEFWQRTQRDQADWPQETAAPGTFVQVAAVYEGKRVSLYREGVCFARYDIDTPLHFDGPALVLFGKRHLDTQDNARFRGAILDARIYGRALSDAEVAALRPNTPSDPAPVAWWDFRSGLTDRLGAFPETVVRGGATLEDGTLVLGGDDPIVFALEEAAVVAGSAAPAMVAGQRELRERLLADPHRPAYHFVSPEGACMPFDPNGAIYWNGRYHLFYIFQDGRGHCWGHASSADLLHWRWHTPGLYPAPGDVDQGIFSGNCFVNKDGAATILYHGVGAGNCIATSDEPGLDHWTKLASNPIIPNPVAGSPEAALYSSWDPHGWLEGDTYYAIFGGGRPTIFKADTLDDWRYVGDLLAHNMPDVGDDEDVSCPDIFPIGDRHMLLCISHNRGARYYLGKWKDEQFHPESHARMNWEGGYCFAPETLLDAQGRRIMWAWVLDDTGTHTMDPGWSGVMTLPRVLSLAEDGTLRIAPVEELERLRVNPQRREGIGLRDGAPEPVDLIAGDCLELRLRIDPGTARRVVVEVRRAPEGAEVTPIVIDRDAGVLRIDVAKSSADETIQYFSRCMTTPEKNRVVTAQEAPFVLGEGEALDLRVFLDHSILEVYANGRQCVTQRIYPTREDSRGIALRAEGGDATVTTLDAWEMSPTVHW